MSGKFMNSGKIITIEFGRVSMEEISLCILWIFILVQGKSLK